MDMKERSPPPSFSHPKVGRYGARETVGTWPEFILEQQKTGLDSASRLALKPITQDRNEMLITENFKKNPPCQTAGTSADFASSGFPKREGTWLASYGIEVSPKLQ
eukprot:TRINITY_DN33036_c0_g1_i1.p1 TRINITY_DN33036_c0_g1~~TRINITY_DN33036_c0_g1_i1.p1  ORF type:complete len:106 (-),score=8.19 TRINITY_DN33036_c0_g1_i1:189-506(-)